MRQAQVLRACAVFGLALLADCLIGGSAYAQHAAEGGNQDFVFRFSIFVLAIFVGYYVVWSVTPALHTPLMSVTNAISAIVIVGAMLAAALTEGALGKTMGVLAVALAAVNVFGGFLVTRRMLEMFRKKTPAKKDEG
jgi:H+-translocating NAD(P) transhydrogenase subunit alpha